MDWLTRPAEVESAEPAPGTRRHRVGHASVDGYVVISEFGHILDANHVIAALSGYSRDELCRKTLADLDSKLAPGNLSPALDQARRRGEVRFQTQWRCRDGLPLHLEVTAAQLPGHDAGRFHAFLRDISLEIAARRRIERLNAFHVFLSHANAAIFKLDSIDRILDAVCAVAVRDGGFVLAWAGVLEPDTGRVVARAAAGVATEYIRDLVVTTDPLLATSQGPTGRCMAACTITHTDDFQSDTLTAAWHEMAREYGIGSSAAVPIVVDGQAVAALNFYAQERNFFDAEFRGLLEEVARNLSLAWQSVASQAQRRIALERREQSERSFAKVLDVSPIPIQVHSLATRKIIAINQAHRRTFGYGATDIPDEESWFERAYGEPGLRQQIRDAWELQLQQAGASGPDAVMASPELTVRCKDGTDRQVKGYMSVVGDEVVVQWLDVTEAKRAEAGLIESERSLRAMIEQTLTGIYVAQRERIVFVNPRLSEIVGWTRQELLGRESLDFFSNSPGAREKILAAREQLAAGTRSVALDLPFRRKDGECITLGTHASLVVWGGHQAVVVICQDITERQRAAEKIAAYVRQLEGTMQGTLQAVANMVELRDPYTAGHERRVGLIAADIAREMGWPEDRCRHLQMIGLVHDIGKIGVPAEILSKPTRLTPLEYELVKAHAERGYEILREVEFPLPIAEIIRQHHERMDGSGYPQGLQGPQILPEARILAVADVLESMASHRPYRPYRPAQGIDAAVQEIDSHRGCWFDETVVAATLRLIREKNYCLPS